MFRVVMLVDLPLMDMMQTHLYTTKQDPVI
nr:MAG TPA: hypothetical protein [Caudoviricetes sp.]